MIKKKKQRLHVKKCYKKFLNSIKLFLLFCTKISSTEYRDVQYWVPRCRICSVPRCPNTFVTTTLSWICLLFFSNAPLKCLPYRPPGDMLSTLWIWALGISPALCISIWKPRYWSVQILAVPYLFYFFTKMGRADTLFWQQNIECT